MLLLRAVEDYDVDRADVEVQQCMKLTATNSPFGLTIRLIVDIKRIENARSTVVARQYSRKLSALSRQLSASEPLADKLIAES